MSEEPATELLPWNEVMAGRKPGQFTSKTERELYIPGFKVVACINDRFAAAVGY